MPSRKMDKYQSFLNIATEVANLSTCQFTKVGCVIVTPDFRPVSFGYNGTPAGHVHCNELEMTRDEHAKFAEEKEVHAEMNALLQADRSLLKGSIVFTTITPCASCMKHLFAAGVSEIISGSKYWRMSQDDLEKMIKTAEEYGVKITVFDTL